MEVLIPESTVLHTTDLMACCVKWPTTNDIIRTVAPIRTGCLVTISI